MTTKIDLAKTDGTAITKKTNSHRNEFPVKDFRVSMLARAVVIQREKFAVRLLLRCSACCAVQSTYRNRKIGYFSREFQVETTTTP